MWRENCGQKPMVKGVGGEKDRLQMGQSLGFKICSGAVEGLKLGD